MQLGLREANQHFSKAIKAVKAGQEVVLTERGKPIAVIKPLPPGDDVDAALRRMEAAGLLTRATRRGPMPPFRPRRIKGPPLSHTIREERDED
ncbi:MAG: type II toxin-antitoxin system prevent-host-death family antitoxin [Deltaproteobacteria bacterium]|nr:type II toxin-antitoxin system prevent-host-death family antitoxin [Deltaproteobacteria bacterium]MBI3386385.1 type II toxin-antitoxin system prevent-host-death family antitoxin [Deltaproteobacteria bacterium]